MNLPLIYFLLLVAVYSLIPTSMLEGEKLLGVVIDKTVTKSHQQEGSSLHKNLGRLVVRQDTRTSGTSKVFVIQIHPDTQLSRKTRHAAPLDLHAIKVGDRVEINGASPAILSKPLQLQASHIILFD